MARGLHSSLTAFVPVALAALAALLVAREQEGYALAFLGAVLYLLFFAARPEAAVLVYVVTRPVVDLFVNVSLGPITLGVAWGIGLLAILALYLLAVPRLAPTSTSSPVIPVAFLGLFALLTLWRPDTSFAATIGGRLAAWVLLMLVAERIARTADGQRAVLRAGFASALLVLAAIGLATGDDRYGTAYYSGDFSSVGQGPHGLASFAVLTAPFVLGYLLVRRRGRLLPLMTGVLLSAAVVLSFVRTAFLSLVLLLGAATFLAVRHRRAAVVGAVLPAVLAVAVTIFLTRDTISERVADLSYLTSDSGSSNLAGAGRIGYWRAVTDAAFASPQTALFGSGAGSSIEHIREGIGVGVWSHNDFLELLATGGILLVSSYVLLLGWMGRSALALSRDVRQSEAARGIGWLTASALLAFVALGAFNGVAFSASSIGLSLLVGLARGLSSTPGQTFLDLDATARDRAWHQTRCLPAPVRRAL